MTTDLNTNSVQFFKDHPLDKAKGDTELIVAAWQVSSPENIGKIIRLGHNAGAKEVLFIQGEEKHRMSKIRKTAGFSFEQQKWRFISEEDFIQTVLPEFELAVLETCDGAVDIYKSRLPSKIILLAGSESHGLPEQIIAKSQYRVFIPMPGGCKSLNISNALSVATFEWYRQQYY